MSWSFRNLTSVLGDVKEKAEQTAARMAVASRFVNFVLYGVTTILLLKLSQVLLGWSF